MQRFGDALNLNVHIHALVLNGVFARAEDGRPAFHATPTLTEADVVRRQTPVVTADISAAETPVHAPEPSDDGSGSRWADLMRLPFGFDVLACPRCGGRLRRIALLDESAVTQRILRHLGLPTEVPEARPARAPPLRDSDAWSSATRHAR